MVLDGFCEVHLTPCEWIPCDWRGISFWEISDKLREVVTAISRDHCLMRNGKGVQRGEEVKENLLQVEYQSTLPHVNFQKILSFGRSK